MCERTAGVLTSLLIAACCSPLPAQDQANPFLAWGADHVGKPFPLYLTGDECLFCHRDIGSTWHENRHQLTIRTSAPNEQLKAFREEHGDAADHVDYVMGSNRTTRFLKRSDKYGKFEIHTGSWNESTFGDRCAGCHTTAVDTTTRAFAGISLDCFTCHGDLQLTHTEDSTHALLSAENRRPRQVTSVCGQCHLRGGRSRSSGLPYPNTFVPGDNLFLDFDVDLTDAAINAHDARERHIFLSARDIAVHGQTKMDCLSCHDVHAGSTEKHQDLADAKLCSSCHRPGQDKSQLHESISLERSTQKHSSVCDY